MGEDPPRKKKRSQIAGKVESKTNSAPGHDGGINEKSDEEGAEEYDEEDEEELDEQDKDNLDKQNVEEPDKDAKAVGGDGPSMPPPPLPPPRIVRPPPPDPVCVWDEESVCGQAYSCTGGQAWGTISIMIDQQNGRRIGVSVFCRRHGCQFAKLMNPMPSREAMLGWFVAGQAIPAVRNRGASDVHKQLWPV